MLVSRFGIMMSKLYVRIMRTTMNIDDDVFELAKTVAESSHVSVGKALSQLARRGLDAKPQVREDGGFYVFNVPSGAGKFGPDEVRRGMDDEGESLDSRFKPGGS